MYCAAIARWRAHRPARRPVMPHALYPEHDRSYETHISAGGRIAQRGGQPCPKLQALSMTGGVAGTCALAGASASAAGSYAGCAAAGGAAVSNGAVQDAARALFSYTNATCSYPSARPSPSPMPHAATPLRARHGELSQDWSQAQKGSYAGLCSSFFKQGTCA